MAQAAPMGAEQGGLIDWFRRHFGRGPKQEKPLYKRAPQRKVKDLGRFLSRKGPKLGVRPGMEDLGDYISGRFGAWTLNKYGNVHNVYSAADPKDKERGSRIPGMGASRMIPVLASEVGGDMTKEEIGDMLQEITAASGVKTGTNLEETYSPEQVEDMDQSYVSGMLKYKGTMLQHLRRMESRYGVTGSQMHPEDFLTRVDSRWLDDKQILQDCNQLSESQDKRIFDAENNPEDEEFARLSDYFSNVFLIIASYTRNSNVLDHQSDFEFDSQNMEQMRDYMNTLSADTAAVEESIRGPRMSPKEQDKYLKALRKKHTRQGTANRLFGRFL